jgi:hypothetical protein
VRAQAVRTFERLRNSPSAKLLYRRLEDAQPPQILSALRTFEKTRRFCKAAKNHLGLAILNH